MPNCCNIGKQKKFSDFTDIDANCFIVAQFLSFCLMKLEIGAKCETILQAVPTCACPPRLTAEKCLQIHVTLHGSVCIKAGRFQWKNHSILSTSPVFQAIKQTSNSSKQLQSKRMLGNKLVILALAAFVLVEAIEAHRCKSSSSSEECCPCDVDANQNQRVHHQPHQRWYQL